MRVVLTEMGKLAYDRVLLCFYRNGRERWLGSLADGAAPLGVAEPRRRPLVVQDRMRRSEHCVGGRGSRRVAKSDRRRTPFHPRKFPGWRAA